MKIVIELPHDDGNDDDNYDDSDDGVSDRVISNQSVTSRLETSQYRDFFHFFESFSIGLDKFGLEKKSRYRFRKILV